MIAVDGITAEGAVGVLGAMMEVAVVGGITKTVLYLNVQMIEPGRFVF